MPQTAVFTTFDVVEIFLVSLLLQYGHSILFSFESPYNFSRSSNGYLGVNVSGIARISLIILSHQPPVQLVV